MSEKVIRQLLLCLPNAIIRLLFAYKLNINDGFEKIFVKKLFHRDTYLHTV